MAYTQHFCYTPQGGVCSKLIEVELLDNTIESVHFTGGCPGNTMGVATLIKGVSVDRAIELLSGIDCRGRGTSCPDQLAQALKAAKK